MSKRITFLLGAGAAKPWGGCLAKDFDQKFKDLETKTVKKMLSDVTLGQYIYDKLDGVSPNFETFLAFIEEIYMYLSKGTVSGFRPIIYELNQELETYFNNGVNAKNIFNEYVEIVKKHVFDYDYKNKVDYNDLFVRFVKYLKPNESKNILRFYTLNYDNLFPQILEKTNPLFNGFIPTPNKELQPFDYLEARRLDNDVYYNLHGSIYWKRDYYDWSSEDYKFFIDTEDDRLEYEKKILDTSLNYPGQSGNPREYLIDSNIIVGYNKSQRILSPQSNILFNNFYQDCSTCDTIVFIGYSFSDPHINNLICSALKERAIKIVNITYAEQFSFDRYYIDSRGQGNSLWNAIKGDDLSNPNYSEKSKDLLTYQDGFDKFLSKEKWHELFID